MMTSIQSLNAINTNIVAKSNNNTRLTGNKSFKYALDAEKGLIESNVASEIEVSQKTLDYQFKTWLE